MRKQPGSIRVAERERERERDRETETETERQRDRETERETHTHTHAHTHTHTHAERHTHTHTHTHAQRETHIQTQTQRGGGAHGYCKHLSKTRIHADHQFQMCVYIEIMNYIILQLGGSDGHCCQLTHAISISKTTSRLTLTNKELCRPPTSNDAVS